MNVYDYLLEESGFLYKKVLLGNKEELTYNELNCEALKLARYIRETYGENNNIVLVAPNSIYFMVVYMAIMKSGNVCVPLNSSVEENNLRFIVDLCDSKIAFVAPALSGDPRWNMLEKVYHEIPEKKSGKEGLDLNLFNEEPFDGERLAEIIFTSGSTGEPKGVMITHKNIIANTDSIIEYLKLTADDVIEIVLPFYYCYGLSLLHTHLKVGGSVVFNNNFMFLGAVINDLKKYKCTGFAGVPSHFQVLLRKSKSFKSDHFPDLRYVTQAGGKLHKVFIQEFIDNQPDITFYVMYGQTEATARLSYLPPERLEDKLGSLGKAIPGVTLELVDDQGNPLLDSGVVGELVAKGDNIMKGYLGDKEGTDSTLKDGWLHTGDLAYRDDDGFFFHTARRKEIIKVGGRRISPKEIEEVIVTIPGVVDCSISAIFDEILGEALKAEVVVADLNDSSMNEMAFKKLCGEKLAMEKVPQVFEFSSRMRIADTGKKTKKLNSV
ncbi:MAG: AMP-binding protein [Bacteroidales bacterium]|nr:AMP-binding protein [Bacteroidales bacterium]